MIILLQSAASAQASDRAFITIMFIGFGVAIMAVVVGTWSGIARAAYIRAYNKAHGVKLPAGWIEEVAWVFDLNYNKGDLDPLRIRQREMRLSIWRALRERQTDSVLERLRERAYCRSTIAYILGVLTMVGICIFGVKLFFVAVCVS